MSWQPIETAPKTGDMFLCWVVATRYLEHDDGGYEGRDVSDIDFCAWNSRYADGGDGFFENMAGAIGDEQYISHWQPLPQPPDEN